MEDKLRWTAVTAIAPVAWGTTYFVTRHFLPADAPLWGGVLRALPAGLLLLLLRRERPHGSLWWKSLVLGTLNVGAFFVLVYVAAQRLPTSIASTVMAASSMVIMVFAWLILAERPRLLALTGVGVGFAGVCLMVLSGGRPIDPLGLLASFAAMAMSSAGYVLAKRWNRSVDVLSSTAWQLIGGGLVLLPFAVLAEGRPPLLDGPALLGFGYVSVIATALAFAAWFTGLRHLRAGTVGLIGLLNPVTGVLLGHFLAAESLGARQMFGLALVLIGVVVGGLDRGGSRSEGGSADVVQPVDRDRNGPFSLPRLARQAQPMARRHIAAHHLPQDAVALISQPRRDAVRRRVRRARH
jgi:probable blue pigment (indigoidine) exporter